MSKFAIQAAVAVAILLFGLVLGLAMAPDTDELEAQVAALEAAVQGQASADALTGLNSQIESVNGRLDALGAKVDAQANAPAPGSERLDGLEGAVEDLAAMADARLSALEGLIPESAGLPPGEVAALKRQVDELAGRFAALESDHDARHGSTAAAGEAKMAAAPAAAARPEGLDAPGVHELGVGSSVWLVEKQIFLALSRIEPGEAAYVYVNATPFTLPLGQEVLLRGIASDRGPCRATLKHAEKDTAFVQARCG